MEKDGVKIGDKLYLRKFTGLYYIDICKDPYTVIDVSKSKITIQGCKLIAPIYHCSGNPYFDRPDLEGKRVFFYDTVAESIEEDKYNKDIKYLYWKPKMQMWGTKGDYPSYAIFGEWKHQPYLD